ncbi:MAG: 16S rRNA (guanine(527)-N(7))-methyltransferase RsmG [Pseudomonadota bacterium]
MDEFPELQNPALRETLESGAKQLDLALSGAQITDLLIIVAMLSKWNRAYNLTAIRDPRDMVIKHLLDSLAAAPAISGDRVLDVGTGGGFPGLPLAITKSDQTFVLLDASAKKVRFVQRVIDALGLENASAIHARVEDYVETPFDVVTCRAFASLADIVAWTQHLVADGGKIVALKGQSLSSDESGALPAGWHAEQRQVVVPLLTGERHLVTVRHH